jgi:peptidoglycan/LPS O-acetylase OafA/YrhL
MAAPPRRLDSLTGLRFFAALLVVLHHFSYFEVARFGVVDGIATLGYLGVEFFFVLSGVVLAWTMRPGDTARGFYRRRFARVFPLHLLFLIPGAVMVAIGLSEVTAKSVALTVPLLQAWWPTVDVVDEGLNGPDWSLSCELFFYALFPLMAARLVGRSTRSVALVGVAAVAGMLGILAAGTLAGLAASDMDLLVYHSPGYRLGEFVVGVMLGTLLSRQATPTRSLPSLPFAVAAIVAALAVLSLNPEFANSHRSVVQLVTLPFWVALIGAAAVADLDGRASVFRRPVCVKLGVWSFAFYLAHLPMIAILLELSPEGFSSALPLAIVEAVVMVSAMVAVAAAAHVLVEVPVERRLRGKRLPSVIQRQDLAAGLVVPRKRMS